MTGPQAGWYPDPEDPAAVRYWDGDRWTDHVQAAPTQPATPDAEPTSPPSTVYADEASSTAWSEALGAGEPSTTPAGDDAGPPPPPWLAAPAAPPTSGRSVPVALVTVLASIVLVGVLGVVAFSSSTSEPTASPSVTNEAAPAEPRVVDPDAITAAGCEEVDPGDGSDRDHFELHGAPPAEEIYDVPLPAWGPHTPQVLPEMGLADRPLDLRVLLHNLEHGAVVVWLGADTYADARTREDVAAWLGGLQAGGFRSDAGTYLYASPAQHDADVAPVSLRAWGVAIDCPAWDAAAADAFVAQHYGSRGEAPESMLGPYPDGGPLLDR